MPRLVIVSRIPGVDPVADTTAPTVPTNLAAAAVNSGRIDVSWGASTDLGVGLAGYQLEWSSNGSTGWTLLVQQPTRTYSHTSLNPSTQYFYRVRAYDAVTPTPNYSAYSPSSSATTSASSPVTINVTNSAELVSAVATANSNGVQTTIVLAPATYVVPDANGALQVNGSNTTFRSSTSNAADVVVQGDAMSTTANVQFIFRMTGPGATFQYLTLQRCRNSIFQIEGGANNGTITGCVLRDSQEHLTKATIVGGTTGANGWVIEDSQYYFTAGMAPQQYNGGIDAHRASNWIVRRNTFRDIASPVTSACQHAVNPWNGCTGWIIEDNLVIDCDRGIGDGLNGNPANDNNTMRNNMVYHSANSDPFADVGIAVENATNAKVFNNTVYFANSFTWCMEYRFTTTGAQFINNLTNKQILARDGGTATKTTNIETAQASWFVDVTTGDLRLSASAPASVVDVGTAIASVTKDRKGTSRPQGSGYDIGADEYVSLSSPSSLPLLQSTAFTYLGSFNAPDQAGGAGDAFATNYGGHGLGMGNDGNSLYMGCHDQQGSKVCRFSIPASFGGTGVIQVNATTIPGTFATNTQNLTGGILTWNGRVIVSRFGYYTSGSGADQINSHASATLGLTGFSTPQIVAGGGGPRWTAGYMGVIPSEWRASFNNYPCFTGAGPRSIDSNACLGLGFWAFNPDQVATGGPSTVPSRVGASYSLGSELYGDDGFKETKTVCGAGFIPGTRTVAFIGNDAQGTLQYGTFSSAVDPCNGGTQGFHQYPYPLHCWLVDANDLVRAGNGQISPSAVVPYAHFDLPGGPGGLCNQQEHRGACYDIARKRLYMAVKASLGHINIHVWGVAAP